ncbi:MAG: hypothetical protein AB1656_19370 [Candidatus Omnitrophota bacterium]
MERERIQDEANRKRSEATKAQPRNDDGTMAEKEPVVGQSVPLPVDRHEGREAKAAASKTNAGAAEQ